MNKFPFSPKMMKKPSDRKTEAVTSPRVSTRLEIKRQRRLCQETNDDEKASKFADRKYKKYWTARVEDLADKGVSTPVKGRRRQIVLDRKKLQTSELEKKVVCEKVVAAADCEDDKEEIFGMAAVALSTSTVSQIHRLDQLGKHVLSDLANSCGVKAEALQGKMLLTGDLQQLVKAQHVLTMRLKEYSSVEKECPASTSGQAQTSGLSPAAHAGGLSSRSTAKSPGADGIETKGQLELVIPGIIEGLPTEKQITETDGRSSRLVRSQPRAETETRVGHDGTLVTAKGIVTPRDGALSSSAESTLQSCSIAAPDREAAAAGGTTLNTLEVTPSRRSPSRSNSASPVAKFSDLSDINVKIEEGGSQAEGGSHVLAESDENGGNNVVTLLNSRAQSRISCDLLPVDSTAHVNTSNRHHPVMVAERSASHRGKSKRFALKSIGGRTVTKVQSERKRTSQFRNKRIDSKRSQYRKAVHLLVKPISSKMITVQRLKSKQKKKCPCCSYVIDMRLLRHHIMLYHRRYVRVCEVCRERVASRSEYKLHLKQHNMIPPSYNRLVTPMLNRPTKPTLLGQGTIQTSEAKNVDIMAQDRNKCPVIKVDVEDDVIMDSKISSLLEPIQSIDLHEGSSELGGEDNITSTTATGQKPLTTGQKPLTPGQCVKKDPLPLPEDYLRVFQCPQCDYVSTKAGIWHHQRRHHGKAKYLCDVCNKTFVRLCDVTTHQKGHFNKDGSLRPMRRKYGIARDENGMVRPKETDVQSEPNLDTGMPASSSSRGKGLYKCDVCGYEATRCGVRNHKRRHHSEKPFTCSICLKAFVISWEYKRHYNSHFDEKGNPKKWLRLKSGVSLEDGEESAGYVCEICNREFQRESNLARHKVKVHEKAGNEEGSKFQCEYCSYQGKTKTEVDYHVTRIHREHEYKCEECGRTYAFKRQLDSHIAVQHEGAQSSTCELCGRQFKAVRYLKAHMERHEKKYKIFCSICEKGFMDKARLKEHMETHKTPEERTTRGCKICGTVLLSEAYMKEHMKIHLERKQYSCDICQREFSLKQTMTKHKRTHLTEKPFPCPRENCGKTFYDRGGLKSHMVKHTGVSDHMCTACRRVFTQASSLRRHVCKLALATMALARVEKRESLLAEQQPTSSGMVLQRIFRPGVSEPTSTVTISTSHDIMVPVKQEVTEVFEATDLLQGINGQFSGSGPSDGISISSVAMVPEPTQSEIVEGLITTASEQDVQSNMAAGDEVYQCSICQTLMPTWNDIQEHMMVHTENEQITVAMTTDDALENTLIETVEESNEVVTMEMEPQTVIILPQ